MDQKPMIQEFIVVEGRDDTTAIHRAVLADTIETNGSALNEKTIERIRLAAETRGVIVFTDPDFPGEKIRKQIDAEVPGCKHAFLSKIEARPKNGRGIGVEHATPESIRKALAHFHQTAESQTANTTLISKELLIKMHLLGGTGSKARRARLGDILRIGYTNGKQLQARLNMFGIDESKLQEAYEQMKQEAGNE